MSPWKTARQTPMRRSAQLAPARDARPAARQRATGGRAGWPMTRWPERQGRTREGSSGRTQEKQMGAEPAAAPRRTRPGGRRAVPRQAPGPGRQTRFPVGEPPQPGEQMPPAPSARSAPSPDVRAHLALWGQPPGQWPGPQSGHAGARHGGQPSRPGDGRRARRPAPWPQCWRQWPVPVPDLRMRVLPAKSHLPAPLRPYRRGMKRLRCRALPEHPQQRLPGHVIREPRLDGGWSAAPACPAGLRAHRHGRAVQKPPPVQAFRPGMPACAAASC